MLRQRLQIKIVMVNGEGAFSVFNLSQVIQKAFIVSHKGMGGDQRELAGLFPPNHRSNWVNVCVFRMGHKPKIPARAIGYEKNAGDFVLLRGFLILIIPIC